MSIKLLVSGMSSGSFSAFYFQGSVYILDPFIFQSSLRSSRQLRPSAETERCPLPVSADLMLTFFEPTCFVILLKNQKELDRTRTTNTSCLLYFFLLDSVDTLCPELKVSFRFLRPWAPTTSWTCHKKITTDTPT